MKKYLIIALLSISLSSPVYAQEWPLSSLQEDLGSFLLGFAGGLTAHELGHVAVALSKGYSVDYDGISIVYPDAEMSDSDHLEVASAGFQVQWLVSEVVFLKNQHRKSDTQMNNLDAGLIFAHLATTAAYLTFLKGHADGDIVGMSSATGISADKLALLMSIPAVFDTWRLFGKQVPNWVPTLSRVSKGLMVTLIWTF